MEYFLERIAGELHSEFGNTLNRHCLVFPNRRAGLYLLKYLAARIDKPVWTPPVLTINELFHRYSPLQIAGNEVLLFELYKIYRRVKESPVSFDDFFFWGDMLLNDFDDVDKYLVDASLLFRNIQDIKEIDRIFGGLTDEQVEIIRNFWISFNPEKATDEKEGFRSIWSVLFVIYQDFRSSLSRQNLAYEGMIFREVAEDSGKDLIAGTGWDMVHFIGFNALNRCEKDIMNRLKKAGRARFYWDYDKSYIREGDTNSAGYFMRSNLKMFGNNMPSGWNYDTLLASSPGSERRRVIATSSDVAQVKLIPGLIDELRDITADNSHHTAVVLADENLIIPVITSLPDNTVDINITMGYPIKETLVYALVKQLMEIQLRSSISGELLMFGSREVAAVLKHPIIKRLIGDFGESLTDRIIKDNLDWIPAMTFSGNEILSHIFIKPPTAVLLSDYFRNILSVIASDTGSINDSADGNTIQADITNEFIYRIVLSVNRLESILGSDEVNISTAIYIRILDRLIRMQSVPFSGEPLSGIQVMGILETRALDFKNLVILSVNEGVLPAVSAGSSYIPFSLRDAFGLPSVNHQESIYAYHFYRLLHRAENVTFIYNSNPEGLRSGEMSRFITQMKYEEGNKPEFYDLKFEIKTPGSIPEILERTEEHTQILKLRFTEDNRLLSPSAINTWLACRMKFFYRYINNLKEPEKVSYDIDPAALGSILHESMKSLYIDWQGKMVTSGMLSSMISARNFLAEVTGKAIREKFRKSWDSPVSGNELIVREVLQEYMVRILRSDKNVAPFTILHLEEYFRFQIMVLNGDSSLSISTGGQADRIDSSGGITRIVDYKTGAVADSISSVSELFEDDRAGDVDPWLQTLLYCEAYLVKNPGSVVKPSVYKIRKLGQNYLSDSLCIKQERNSEIIISDYSAIREEFIAGIAGVIKTIFNGDEPFTMTGDARGKCTYCQYRGLCMR